MVEAADGVEAVALYQSEQPDVVFLDITMPAIDGLAALEDILKINAQARIAMASAMGQQGVVIQALKAGAKDLLVKPFEPERVIKTLDKLLA